MNWDDDFMFHENHYTDQLYKNLDLIEWHWSLNWMISECHYVTPGSMTLGHLLTHHQLVNWHWTGKELHFSAFRNIHFHQHFQTLMTTQPDQPELENHQLNQLHKNVQYTTWLTYHLELGVPFALQLKVDKKNLLSAPPTLLCYKWTTTSSTLEMTTNALCSLYQMYNLHTHSQLSLQTKALPTMLKLNSEDSFMNLDVLMEYSNMTRNLHWKHLQKRL